jgi:hypothetical protein
MLFFHHRYSRVLAKLGSGALAPPICEAKAITSNAFWKKFNEMIVSL